MNKLISFFIFFICTTLLSAQSSFLDKKCIYGFEYEISDNKNWGFGEPVITYVRPFSAAELNGFNVNDIVMEIAGKATYLNDSLHIAYMFEREVAPEVNLTIRNTDAHFSSYFINRECLDPNAIDEMDIATIFKQISNETMLEESFVLPTKLFVHDNEEVDYTDYHTFSFKNEGLFNEEEQAIIEDEITNYLLSLGLLRDDVKPNFYIMASLNVQSNPLAKDIIVDIDSVLRFDVYADSVTYWPVYGVQASMDEKKKAKYVSNLNIQFLDNRFIDKDQFTPLWEVSLNDFWYSVPNKEVYLKIHIPLLLKTYPYKKTSQNQLYQVEKNKFLYTGLYFDKNNLTKITDVDRYSPAYQAGVRDGFILVEVAGMKVKDHESLLKQYHEFLESTKKYRTSSEEDNALNSYWNDDVYKNIAKDVKKIGVPLAYVYGAEAYVSLLKNGKIPMKFFNGYEILDLELEPQMRNYTTILLKDK